MSTAEEKDYTNIEHGALPSLDAKPDDVLGEPTGQSKAKTNVSKLILLGMVLVGFLFVIVGILWYAKHRNSALKDPLSGAAKPTLAQKNEALESASIERRKAELKERQVLDEAAKKTAQASADADRARNPPPTIGGPQAGIGAPAGPTSSAGSTAPPGQTAQAGPQSPPPPKPPTADERRMSGGVLVSTLRVGDNGQQPAATAQATPVNGGFFGAQQQPAAGSESIASALRPTVLDARSAGMLPNLDYLLKRGTTIPCALQTGIDTTLAGFVICKTLSDVYSANGKILLFDRGSSIFGEQQSGLKQGQERTFVLWTRIDTPTGVFANIDSPATDAMGYNGIEGYVDTHFWKRFGGAIMLSLIQDFSQRIVANQNQGFNANNGQNYNNTTKASQDMSSEALRNSINIPPTLYVRPATVVNVMVARDISFESVYGLLK